MLESTRDYETEEHVSHCDALKEALLSNLAAACLAQGEAAKAIEWCDKALEMNPDNAKVGANGLCTSLCMGMFCSTGHTALHVLGWLHWQAPRSSARV